MKIILETERLILREYTPDDFDALFAIVGDSETMKHYPKPYDERGTKWWITWSLGHYEKHGFGFWAVILKETGELIGNCGLTMQIIDGESLPEIGYHIHKKYWRMGYAKEASRAVRDWAFTNTDYPALYSYMTGDNDASVSTAASVGMKKTGEFTDARYGEMLVYAVTRDAWEELKR